MESIILVGGGQHCGVVLYNLREQNLYKPACILEKDAARWGTRMEDVLIDGGDDDENLDRVANKYGTNKFIISLGSMKLRKRLFTRLVAAGWEPVNVIHPNAVISDQAKIGKGVLIECGCLITPNPVIGDNVVVNTGSQVNHDNIIGPHTYLASGVILSGGVHIGENTLLDDGVIVTLGRSVGCNSLVGAGAVVTKDVPDGVISYGNPAMVIRENTKFE